MSNDSIKISVDIVDKAASSALKNLLGQSNQLEQGMKKAGDSGSSAFSSIAVSIGKATGIYDIFVGNLAANLATKAIESIAAAATKLFNIFIVDGIKAAQEQAVAIAELNQALANTGKFSQDTSKEIQKFASTLEETTGVSEELILKNAALIQNLANLDTNGLKRATNAALELSAVYDRDLGTTSEALAKAANGNTTALQKLGIQFKKGTTDAETFENILDVIEGRFSGTAVAKVNNYKGSLALLGVQFGNLQKEIGKGFTENNALVAVFQSVGKILGGITGNVKEQSQAWKELVGKGIILGIESLIVLTENFDNLWRLAKAIISGIKASFYGLGAAIYGIVSIFTDDFDQAFNDFSKKADESMGDVHRSITEDTGLTDLKKKLEEVETSAVEGFAAMKRGVELTKEPVNNTSDALNKLNKEAKNTKTEFDKWVESLAKSDNDPAKQLSNHLEVLKLQNESKLISDQEYLIAKQDAETAALDAEQERLSEYNAKTLEQQQYKVDAQTAIEQKYRTLKLKQDIELKQAEDKLNQQKFDATKDTFSNLTSLMQTSSKELFAIGKAASIALATMNTYEAITKTMASVPYPFNIPLAIAQGIAGFVQVSNIAATQPRFEQGGIVPGNSFSGDNVSARVNSGEMILNKSQQKELFNMANGDGGSSGLVGELRAVRSLLGSVLSMPITVNVDGKELFRVIRDGQNAGRSFAV